MEHAAIHGKRKPAAILAGLWQRAQIGVGLAIRLTPVDLNFEALKRRFAKRVTALFKLIRTARRTMIGGGRNRRDDKPSAEGRRSAKANGHSHRSFPLRGKDLMSVPGPPVLRLIAAAFCPAPGLPTNISAHTFAGRLAIRGNFAFLKREMPCPEVEL